MMSPRLLAIFLWAFVLIFGCKRGYSEDIQDCNPVADYYDKGTHYIRRDLVRDDNTLDYKKLMEDTKPQASDCYPSNHEVK
ncbi:hypothetical protein AB3N62_00075 [Leptospira sp. WS4.C2]